MAFFKRGVLFTTETNIPNIVIRRQQRCGFKKVGARKLQFSDRIYNKFTTAKKQHITKYRGLSLSIFILHVQKR